MIYELFIVFVLVSGLMEFVYEPFKSGFPFHTVLQFS